MRDLPRPDYPRPQWVRAHWANLNGEWEFAEDPGLAGEERGWTSGQPFDQRILVPFAPESSLSGIGKTDFMPSVWYRRLFRIPDGWQQNLVWLHFGAVDYEATVWVNGELAGRHRGGYSSFKFDITRHLRGGDNELVVRAVDDTSSALQPSGKQSPRLESYGCMYTRTTGIWQTVWLESVPCSHLISARMLPDLDGESLTLLLQAEGAAEPMIVRALVRADGEQIAVAQTPACAGLLRIPVTSPRAWSPEEPFLYQLDLYLQDGEHVADHVETYFGMRKVHLQPPAIHLNNRPRFQRLVLDQGYYADGIYTAPTDDALRRDIELSKAVGFDGARLHEKVFEERFLYWADKLGYLVWGEYPNWGLDHSHPAALEHMLPEWMEVLGRDFNHPSIVGWCPFNETNEQQRPELLRTIHQVTKAIDPTRPAIDTSGYVHLQTDVDDCHDYDQDPAVLARHFAAFAQAGQPWRNTEHDAPHRGQPFFVSEYGGIWWNPGQSGDKAWGYGDRPKSEQEFLQRYRALTETLLRHPKMCGFCYTQLYDIEQEVNGIYTYSRKPKFDPALIKAINQQRAAVEE